MKILTIAVLKSLLIPLSASSVTLLLFSCFCLDCRPYFLVSSHKLLRKEKIYNENRDEKDGYVNSSSNFFIIY